MNFSLITRFEGFPLLQDFEEEGEWCDKKLTVCTAIIWTKDPRILTSLQKKHKALEDEMVGRHNKFLSDPWYLNADPVRAEDMEVRGKKFD